MAGFRIEGNTSGNVAEITTNNELKSIGPNTYNIGANPQIVGGFSNNIFEADNGSVTGSSLQKQGDISANYRQRVAIDTMLFFDQFNTVNANSAIWNLFGTSMTAAGAGGFYNLNSGAINTVNTNNRLVSYRGFSIYGAYPTQLEIEASYTSSAFQANCTVELGFGVSLASGSGAATDGVYFRYTQTGTFVGVISLNGVETLTANLPLPSINNRHHYAIVVGNDTSEFWVDNILYANLTIPAGSPTATLNQNQPIFLRIANGATAPTAAVQFKIASVIVSQGDMSSTRNINEIMVGMGAHSSQAQAGQIAGSTAAFANSAPATTGNALTNGTASATGLGGQTSILPTLATGSDGIMFSYQLPLAAAGTLSKALYIDTIKIQGVVTTALVGNTSPIIYVYSLAYGHTTSALNTIDSANSKSARRLPLGIETYAMTAAVGTLGQGFTINLTTPIFVQPGEFVQLVVKNLGVVTTAGVITVIATVNGFFE